VKGTLFADTDAFRPAILTASDDGSIGESVTSDTLSGGYASTALNFDYVTSSQASSTPNTAT
jgi:hypothetical protein